ncbi:fimbria/pilus outer membrane usher protein [Pseudoduganella sp. R-32]|uniref:fimbria/pilus outer membrane usher protein n=1 Tax=unclassified Pseudoduganella TaxID=2637179 RepID=UPI003CF264B7
MQFNEQFLMGGGGGAVDLSRFARGNPVTPGDYLVDLIVNGEWRGRTSVRFVASPGVANASACLDKALIGRLGLDYAILSSRSRAELAQAQAGQCAALGRLVPAATEHFDTGELRLELNLPQAALLKQPRGYVSPELWDAGVTSATLAYDFNTFHSGRDTSDYLGLRAGLNIGDWHLRHNSSMMRDNKGRRSFDNISTYVQRDLPSLQSQLRVGDAFTDGAVFDSIGIRGLTVATDDNMLPDSLRGYAPLIQGVARTNARVTVTQNGMTLLETTVAPGPFKISDLYATGYGGNLLVTVTEADGSQHSSVVPFASVAQLLRPGTMRYSVSAGRLRDGRLNNGDALLQGTLQRGLNNMVTAYGGVTATQHYWAVTGGAAFNTSLGALSADLTQARAEFARTAPATGQSLRLRYSKRMASTGTNFSLAALRYSSRGYWNLSDTALVRDYQARGWESLSIDRPREQLQLMLSQEFGEGGGVLSLSGVAGRYWNRPGAGTDFTLRYNNSLTALGTNVSYDISAGRQRDMLSGQMDNRIALRLSVPFGRGTQAPMMSLSATHDRGGTSQLAELSGSYGEDNALSYGVRAGHGQDADFGANVSYRTQFAALRATGSRSQGYSQWSGGVSGGVVVHPGGVTLANDLGDTVAVLEAKSAKGASVFNAPGVKVDGRGYAVVPYMTPYRMNNVEIDPKGAASNVDFTSTSAQVAPRANSVVMVRFGTVTGRAALLTLTGADGAPLPFGSTVRDAQGVEVGVVGQGGQLYVRGIEDRGHLYADWGDGAAQRCDFDYHLQQQAGAASPFSRSSAVCVAQHRTADESSVKQGPTGPGALTESASNAASGSP